LVIRIARVLVIGAPNTPVVNSLNLSNLLVRSIAVATAELALALGSAADVELLIGVNEAAATALVILDVVGTPVIAVVSSSNLVRVLGAA
jgi:hypothetical protein